MIYLACPYSHPDPAVREARFDGACRETAAMLGKGMVVFCPVVHSHPLVRYGLPGTWEFWERVDREHLVRCDEVVVLMLDGWKESIGVQTEVSVAGELRKPITYIKEGSYAQTR